MKRRKQRKIFLGRTAVCLIVFAVLLAACGTVLAYRFLRSPDRASGKITYTCGGAVVRTADADTAIRGGKLYVCFNDVADYLSLAVTGGHDSMKFVKTTGADTGSEGSGNEEYVTFMADSRTVEINSQTATLPEATFFWGESVWVTSDFITEYVSGLTVTRKGDTVAISRIKDESASDGKNIVYTDVAFRLKAADPIVLPETEPVSADPINVEFSTDLSAYEEYMNPENSDEYLTLVNSENLLAADYIPPDLTQIVNTRQDGREAQQMRLAAEKSLEALFIEMKAAGYSDVSVTSGYRSYDYQQTLFATYTQNEMSRDPSLTQEAAEAIVVTYSSRPGTSEHQSGLCVDMHNLPSASTEFKDEPAYKWLCENAWKFGFILRYPEAKTDITKISYEPWHWRFVGRTNARKIWEGSMCLEEFIAANAQN